MTLLAGITNTTPTAPQTAAENARTVLTGNFDTFLTLLTAQLQNQDPLEPMDSSKFTEQLVQYSQVEQQIQTNSHLTALSETLTKQIQATAAGSALAYIGREAVFNSNAMGLGAEGGSTWTYGLASTAANSTITVKDASGRIVYQTTGEQSTGPHEFTWDGEDVNGVRQPPGVYYLTVSAKDSADKKIDTGVTVRELINGIDMTNEEAGVTTQSGSRAFTSILRINNPTTMN